MSMMLMKWYIKEVYYVIQQFAEINTYHPILPTSKAFFAAAELEIGVKQYTQTWIQ